MNKYFEVARSLSDMQKAYCYNKPNRKEALISFNKKIIESRFSLILLAKEKYYGTRKEIFSKHRQ